MTSDSDCYNMMLSATC